MEKNKFTKSFLDEIWDSYNQDKILINFEQDELDYMDWYDPEINAPCPVCGNKMVKINYNNQRLEVENAWVVEFIDANDANLDIQNLQPIHPYCNDPEYDK